MSKLVKRKSRPDWERLRQMKSYCMGLGSYRNMLDNIHIGCFVEAELTEQHGKVVSIIRDRYGIPSCLKVKYEELSEEGIEVEGFDFIAVDRITLYEPYSICVPDDGYTWELDIDYADSLLEQGYHWDNKSCSYKNTETGDEIVW